MAHLFKKNMFCLFLLVGQTRPLFVSFSPFHDGMANIAKTTTINGKSVEGVRGFEPRTAEWWAQMNPLSYFTHRHSLTFL